MGNSSFVPLVTLEKKRYTIIEIACLVVEFYKKLERIDNAYSSIRIISEKPSLYPLIKVDDSNSCKLLASEILNQNIEHIANQDKVENPDVHFLMDKAVISFSLEAKSNDVNLLTLNFSFSTSIFVGSKIGIIVASKEAFNTFEKVKLFLDTCNTSFEVEQSAMKIFDRELNKRNRSYKFHLGFVTYFSKNFGISIPDNLEGIEYQFTERGKFLSVVCEDEFKESDVDIYKEKLLKVMEQIESRVPEYLK